MCTIGNWYLPAVGELWRLYNHKATLNNAIISSGGTAFTESYYWASTETVAEFAWVVYLTNGTRYAWGYKYNNAFVRPALQLCAEGYTNVNGICQ